LPSVVLKNYISKMNVLKHLTDYRIQEGDLNYYEYQYFDCDYVSVKEKINNSEIDSELLCRNLIPFYMDSNTKTAKTPGSTGLINGEKLSEKYNSTILFKVESDNPSGSYKDRESWIALHYAVAKIKTKIHIASSGNAAISAAYYAYLYGIECTCYVPKSTTVEKIDLIMKYGAKIEYFDGDYAVGYRLLADNKNENFLNITTGQLPIRSEGGKSLAFELFIQTKSVPDYIVVPVGNGSCMSALWKGYYDLKELGLIEKLPFFVGVVHDTCDVISKCMENKTITYKFKREDLKTCFAEGIVGAESFCSPKILDIVNSNNGAVYSVNDTEIRDAMNELSSSENINIEPTSAAVWACAKKHLDISNKKVVIVLTGRGVD
jgi:threonine synthase